MSKDPRTALLKNSELEVKKISTNCEQEGEFEGEWTAKSKKKKFKRRKFTIRFNGCLSFEPSSIQLMDVNYTGTANLQVIRINKNRFVCQVSSNNLNGGTAKLDFKWKTIK